MDAVTLNAVVSEDRQLIVDLPDDIPVGPVKLVIQPVDAPDDPQNQYHLEVLLEISALRERIFQVYGEMPDSTDLIRDDRMR
ncbi:MAG: hypothetical protein IT324_30265 [Anaerolineae bacterium]|nr:hypothetical protein [Anaerolineae bacterium]